MLWQFDDRGQDFPGFPQFETYRAGLDRQGSGLTPKCRCKGEGGGGTTYPGQMVVGSVGCLFS